MRKVTLFLPLLLIIFLFVCAPAVQAVEGSEVPFSYEIDENNHTVTIVDCYSCDETELIIPEEIDGYPVTSIGEYAFNLCNYTSVYIPDSVTEIQEYAFAGCESLTSVRLPKYITIISQGLFNGCDLTEVSIPSGVTSIGAYAFYENNLTSIELPNGLLAIGEYAFNGADFTKIDLPDSVNCIGKYAFSETKLTSITIPEGIAVIEEGTFSGSPLSNVVIPDTVITIGDCAFCGSGELNENIIPDSVTTLGDKVFYGSGVRKIVIPDSVTSIGEYVFWDCDFLKEVTFSKNITTIPKGTFFECKHITDYVVPGNIAEIGEWAFASCINLVNVTFPDGLKTIGANAFSKTYLQSVVIPNGVTTIGEGAFAHVNTLEYITIPKSVTRIGEPGSHPSSTFPYDRNSGNITVTFCGYAGSYAQTYAEDNFIEFIDLDNVHTHSYTTVVTDPTCVSKGYTTYICTCGAYYEDDFTDEIAHTYGAWTVIKAATSTEKGLEASYCVCGLEQTREIPVLTNPFEDVSEGKFYYEPVLWAYHNDITTGKDASHFNPSGFCTRSQVVTFLWRAAGQPEPASMDNPFPDVPADKFYTKAVLWAVEEGITGGYKDGTFGPNDPCTRGQIVTFLWRYFGQPEPESMQSPFPDVDESKFYHTAVLWAVEEGITGGFKDGTFGPGKTCTRDQIVTFLYRSMVE